MFWSYLKIAFRQLARNRTYSAINILGFALGLAVWVVISLYVIDDLSFDRMHESSDRIYRLLTSDNTQENNGLYAVTSGRLALSLREEIPEIETSVRIFSQGNGPLRVSRNGEVDFNDPGVQVRVFTADSTFADLFDFELLAGDPDQILRTPNSCMISERAKKQLFGDENPLGQDVVYGRGNPLTVNGVYKTPPVNSHMRMDVLIALQINPGNATWWDHWSNVAGMGYFLIREGADPKTVELKIQELAERNNFGDGLYVPRIQALRDIHLGSNDLSYDWINFARGDRTRVVMLSVIGFVVLLIASINFINLSSARAAKRAREVGMRKVVGAERTQLAFQFLGESVLMTLISMLLALIAVQLLMPQLPQFFGRLPVYTLTGTPLLSLAMLLAAMLVGLLSGIYPALVLTSFRPIMVLKGEFRAGRQGTFMRQFLVVSQFAISIALVVGVLVIIQQLNYLRTLNMGYNREQVLTIPMWQVSNPTAFDLLSQEFSKLPGVDLVAGTSHLPGWGMPRYEVRPEGRLNSEKGLSFNRMWVDEGFIPALQIRVAAGRNFSPDFPSDSTQAAIINRTGARAIGWENPLGRRINIVNADGELLSREIIGVVDDFHFMNARQQIEPLLMTYGDDGYGMMLARLQGGAIPQTLERIEAKYHELYPGIQFTSNFFDDVFDFQFQGDRQFARNIAIFAGLAILIACLGLFGLASYATEQRRKEIAVRKVLGSSEGQLVRMLAWDFLKWVAVANLIAWPLGWLGLKRWLDEFTYKTNLTLEPFLLAGLGALVIALLTVAFQSIRAARMNPANALRSDL